jgi:hypothetical protein
LFHEHGGRPRSQSDPTARVGKPQLIQLKR